MVIFTEVDLVFDYVTIVVGALSIALVKLALVLFNAAAAFGLAVENLMSGRLFTFEKSVYMVAATRRSAILSARNSRN